MHGLIDDIDWIYLNIFEYHNQVKKNLIYVNKSFVPTHICTILYQHAI